mgnify:CR=1
LKKKISLDIFTLSVVMTGTETLKASTREIPKFSPWDDNNIHLLASIEPHLRSLYSGPENKILLLSLYSLT